MEVEPTHETERDRWLHFLFPPFIDWVYYFVISSLILAALCSRTLWQFLNVKIFGAAEVVNADYTPVTKPLLDYINQHDTILMLVVWGGFGCLVFFIISFFQKFFRTVKSEVDESHYLVRGIEHSGYWHSVGRLDLLFGGLALTWIVSLWIYFNGFLPWVSHLLFSGLYGPWATGYNVPLALLANLFYLFALFKLTHILLHVWHMIRPADS